MKYLLLIIGLFFYGCQEHDASTTLYNKNITSLPCLKLEANDLMLQMNLLELYHFSKQCNYTLKAEQKSAIVCNSNQNANKKALSNFPHGFLRLDIYGKKEGLIYSYYIDVDKAVKKEMIEEGFSSIKKQFLLQ